ncbi:hypothetical protein AALO_G00005920 [Alosa alosa]|uniref:C2H2-type domain-containing protein n=2 Tax=Alosa alosa TaxID=278164 RepID=A0AAV6HIE0_9TELE|nr:zinc finger protein 316-like isoform X1 [Alosa alosa]KAG5285657.1 hypothetical protein AALO_G00005920 [Alosa alosa]
MHYPAVKMTNANCGSIQTQLGAVMEVLAKAAIAEIIKLFDDSYAVLRLEISRHQNENEDLKRKLQEAKEELRTVQIRIETDNMVQHDWSSPLRSGTLEARSDSPEQPLSIEDKCSSSQGQDSTLMQIKEERLEDDLWSQEIEPMKYEVNIADDSRFNQRLYAESSSSQHLRESTPGQNHTSYTFTQDPPTHVSFIPNANPHLTLPSISNAPLTYTQRSNTYPSDPATSFTGVHEPRLSLKHAQTTSRGRTHAQNCEETVEFGDLRLKAEHQEGKQAAILGHQGIGVHAATGLEKQTESQAVDQEDADLWGPLTEEDEEEDSDTNHSFDDLLYGVEQYSHPHGDSPGDVLHVDTSQTPPSMEGTSMEGFAVAPGTDMAITQPQLQSPQRTAHQGHAQARRPAPPGGPQFHPRLPLPPPELPLHVCSICKKGFTTLSYLRKHLRSHSGERPFTCSICFKHFLCSSHLTIHLRTHTGERPYACGTCGKRFTQQSSLKTHQSVHSGLRPYRCPHCGKSYTLMHHLKRHMGTHEKC